MQHNPVPGYSIKVTTWQLPANTEASGNVNNTFFAVAFWGMTKVSSVVVLWDALRSNVNCDPIL